MPYNVEYTLSVLKCKKRALTTEEREAANLAESIDSKFPRPTAEEVKAALEKLMAALENSDYESDSTDPEVVKELG